MSFFKQIGKGAKTIGSKVTEGSKSLYGKYKEYNSDEAQEKRLDAQEQRLIVQQRIAQRKERIAKLTPQSTGGGFLGSFQGLNQQDVFMGSPQKNARTSPFDTFNGSGFSGGNVTGGLNAGFSNIMGSSPRTKKRRRR